ncbi:MAG TPA: flagellar motor stator protein MotA [Longimicrobiaceae bacterium]
MFVIIGLLIVFGSIIGGYVMHHGQIAVLLQVNEFIIIGGAGLGSMIVANPMPLVKRVFARTFGLLKPNAFGEKAYAELLRVLYDVFQTARKEGLVGLEQHIEEPEKSELFRKYPIFQRNHHAVAFLTDTLKVMLSGAIEDHHLAEILDLDLEQMLEEEMAVPTALHRVGDAMPGFGIVAAVLGVIITMGAIGGDPAELGQKVAAALVGTFVGILLAYGVIGPLGTAVEARIKAEHAYMCCIRTALLSFARGDSPMTSVEFARRNIEPADRPSFTELEQMTRRRAA